MRLLTVVGVTLWLSAGTVHADSSPPAGNHAAQPGVPAIVVEGDMLRLRLPTHQATPGSQPRNGRECLESMLDAPPVGSAFRSPQEFVEWLDAITEPQFMTALATASVDAGTYRRALSGLVRPETARNWAEFTQPLLYMRWLMTGTRPAFYNAIVERLSDPQKTLRWVDYGRAGGPLPGLVRTTQAASATRVPGASDWKRLDEDRPGRRY